MDFFCFSSRRRHTRYWRDWSSDVCSSDLGTVCEADPVLQRLDGRVCVPFGRFVWGQNRRPEACRPRWWLSLTTLDTGSGGQLPLLFIWTFSRARLAVASNGSPL